MANTTSLNTEPYLPCRRISQRAFSKSKDTWASDFNSFVFSAHNVQRVRNVASHLFEYYRANSPIFIVPKGLNENSPFGGVLNFADGSAVERQSSALAGCKMLKLSQSSPGGRCNGLRAAQNV